MKHLECMRVWPIVVDVCWFCFGWGCQHWVAHLFFLGVRLGGKPRIWCAFVVATSVIVGYAASPSVHGAIPMVLAAMQTFIPFGWGSDLGSH